MTCCSSSNDIIIGISCYFHDSAAALIRNGEILVAVQEERFTRKKHDSGFPYNSIKYCLKSQNIKWDQMGDKDNGYCYDEINVAGTSFNFKTGEKAFLGEVLRVFPYEYENVKRYVM